MISWQETRYVISTLPLRTGMGFRFKELRNREDVILFLLFAIPHLIPFLGNLSFPFFFIPVLMYIGRISGWFWPIISQVNYLKYRNNSASWLRGFQKLTLSTPWNFHTEPFVTHPWIGRWLSCMRALAMTLSPMHFLQPGWLEEE